MAATAAPQIVPFRIFAPGESAVLLAIEEPFAGTWRDFSLASGFRAAALAISTFDKLAADPRPTYAGMWNYALDTSRFADGFYLAYVFRKAADGSMALLGPPQPFLVVGGSGQWGPLPVQMVGNANVNFTYPAGPAGAPPASAKASFNCQLVYSPPAK